MLMFLLLPLSDLAISGFKFISAWEALRAFGEYSSTIRRLTSPTQQDGQHTNNGCRLYHEQHPGPLRQYERRRCLHLKQRYFAPQVLFLHDDCHLGADGVEVGVMYQQQHQQCSFTLPYSERFQ